jgi:hypothetical protein
MSEENRGKPASALGGDATKAIGGELRRVYAEIVAEGVQERFAAIVRKLDEASNKGESR